MEQLVQVQLAELEAQRRECLEAITDATEELVKTAEAVDGARATVRVRELEGTVAQLRSGLRAAGGGGRPGAARAAGEGGHAPAGQVQLQAQLRLARQVVLEEQERASLAEVSLDAVCLCAVSGFV